MEYMADGASALLIIRTWREEGSTRPFRAQVSVASDVTAGYSSTITLTDPSRVLEEVRAFLEGWAAPAAPAA
jgi:hypothetical protein